MAEIKEASLAELLLANKIKQREENSKRINEKVKHVLPWRHTLSNKINWTAHNLLEIKKLAHYLVNVYGMRRGWETPEIDKDDIVSDSLLLAVQRYPDTKFNRNQLSRCVGTVFYAYWSNRLKIVQFRREIDINILDPNRLDVDGQEFDLVEGLEDQVNSIDSDSIPSPHSLKEVESMYCTVLDSEDKILDLLDQIEREGK